MELLLNEKSLDGQFASVDEFYNTLPEMSRNLKILKKQGITLLKHTTLFQRKITKDKSLYDIRNNQESVSSKHRDQIRQWKRELSMLMNDPPYWDSEKGDGREEAACWDSLTEAALRKTDVLSFEHELYRDQRLLICCEGQTVSVGSAVSTSYFLDMLLQRKWLDMLDYLKLRHCTGRIVLGYLDNETEVKTKMQESEWEEVKDALSRFDNSKSWEDIRHDRFFDYKSYKPVSKKKDYFAASRFAGKQIDKFRCGQHSQVRCFGYREQEKFYVLAMERDHSISDTG